MAILADGEQKGARRHIFEPRRAIAVQLGKKRPGPNNGARHQLGEKRHKQGKAQKTWLWSELAANP